MRLKKVLAALAAAVMTASAVTVTAFADDTAAKSDAKPKAVSVTINEKNFPDEAFRGYVSENFDTDGNGRLSQKECSAVKMIKVSRMNIKSLKGISCFKNLEELYCGENELTSLNISKNTKLKYLDCSSNALEKLNVSKNVKLKNLKCSGNKLEKLNISKNTKLETLSCSDNGLTYLNISQNTELYWVWCDNNKLSSLDISRNTKLSELYCHHNGLTYLDLSKNADLIMVDCTENDIDSLDTSGCSYFITARCDDGVKITK